MLNYYMVRAMNSSPEHIADVLDHSVVAIGWSLVDIVDPSKSINTITKELNSHYNFYEKDKRQQSKKINEIIRFRSLSVGDRVVIPYGSNILLATISGDHFYQKNNLNDLGNRIEVEYQKTDGKYRLIPRNDLSDGLQRRLRVQGNTVSNLEPFTDELNSIFDDEDYSYERNYNFHLNTAKELFIEDIKELITSGKSNLQAGGIGLENLIAELLEIDGYKTKILSKSSFQGVGDIDIVATKIDMVSEVNIMVQVKHHRGDSGGHGIKQLVAILNSDNKYNDYQPVLLTTGIVSDVNTELSFEHGIKIINLDDLAEWIYINSQSLCSETKQKLLIGSIPIILG